MSPLPTQPWHTVHMDFCGPFPTGEYPFDNTDAYSRFPEVDIVHSTSASAITPRMDRIFSNHGIPLIVKSDNDPPFTSDKIKRYMEENGIKHCRTTPLWSQAKYEVENFMKPLTKATHSAYAEGKCRRGIFTSSFLITKQPLIALLDLLQHNYCSIGKFKTNFHNLLTTNK